MSGLRRAIMLKMLSFGKLSLYQGESEQSISPIWRWHPNKNKTQDSPASDCQNSIWRKWPRSDENPGRHWVEGASADAQACHCGIREFFIQTITGTQVGKRRRLKSTLGDLRITCQQAEKLEVLPHRQLSPHLENCCLRLSATLSYEKAEQEVAYLTGIS